jgi:hypothetical protein
MKTSFASRSPTKTRENTKMDGDLVLAPGPSTSVLWAGAWALSCSFVAPLPTVATNCRTALGNRASEYVPRYITHPLAKGACFRATRLVTIKPGLQFTVSRAAEAGHATQTVKEEPYSPTERLLAIYGTYWCQKESNTSHTVDIGVVQSFADTESPSNCA